MYCILDFLQHGYCGIISIYHIFSVFFHTSTKSILCLWHSNLFAILCFHSLPHILSRTFQDYCHLKVIYSCQALHSLVYSFWPHLHNNSWRANQHSHPLSKKFRAKHTKVSCSDLEVCSCSAGFPQSPM